MWELRFIAVSDDGGHVLVTAPDLDHEEFLLPITDELRDAVAPPARPQQPAPSAGSALTPREIQARIRGGESPEELAGGAGVPLEKVERYAGPVLSERAHVADEAQAARISWQGGHPDAPGGSLGQVIAERLKQDGVDQDAVSWDAWRRDDTVWVVQVRYLIGDERHTAEWSWDPGKRQLRPYGAAARTLSSPRPIEPEPVEELAASPSLRMVPTAVPPAAVAQPTQPSHPAQPVQPAAAAPEQPSLPDLPTGPARPAAAARSRRAAVPSWDDILFGAKHTER